MQATLLLALCLCTLTDSFNFPAHARRGMRLMDASSAYLSGKDPQAYLSTVLRRSADSAAACLADGVKYIEIAFPEKLKNDISVTESLDTNRLFTRELVKKFSSYGKDLWVLFPDSGELNLAVQVWGATEFTMTSISGADKQIKSGASPALMVVVNPGFNVEEWIQLAKIETPASIIIINGNLDRLRNGYYPWFFYPELTKVTDSFYRKFTQAYFVSPIAVSGDFLGAWLCKTHLSDWQVLVREKEGFGVLQTSEKEPQPQQAWRAASKAYKETWGSMF
ncbi:hypothetical protein B484DRAFT_450837 [Ochromonadaceae sp. CCMP2298]|nr:hypothetical protein B484DRAFT_450837 [Ochromonadaceae sp. CCMP2298]|mmetsp:Transcript_30226/g.68662  ORF Transcript_30226/g.68662 Transcript_30226/m.68662 type:complete len:279 (+) Transcript_30226:172-1008(+)